MAFGKAVLAETADLLEDAFGELDGDSLCLHARDQALAVPLDATGQTLAIGDIKYKTESGLFKQMLTSDTPVAFDFRHAYAKAKELTGIA